MMLPGSQRGIRTILLASPIVGVITTPIGFLFASNPGYNSGDRVLPDVRE